MAIVTSMYNYALRCVEGSGVNVASSQWLLVSVCVLKSLSVSSRHVNEKSIKECGPKGVIVENGGRGST